MSTGVSARAALARPVSPAAAASASTSARVRTLLSARHPAPRLRLAALLLVAVCLHVAQVRAHSEPALATAGPTRVEPRVEAVSPEVELIGLHEAGVLRIYVARFATIEPLAGATVGVEAAGQVARGRTDEEGMARLEVPWLVAPGQHPLLFTVAAGDLHDLLSGTLDLPAPGDAVRAHGPGGSVSPWRAALAGGAAGVAIGACGMWLLTRRRRRIAPPALVVLLVAAATMGPAPAVRAHDAAPVAAVASPRAPARQPDGSLFVPVPAQRILGLRTVETTAGAARVPVELAATVIVDPAASGRLQAPVAGRIEPGPRGLPAPGARVARGETVAWLVPTVTPLERGAQQSQLAELDAQIETARARVARYDQLAGSLPQRDIEQARIDLAGLERRRGALAAPLAARLPLNSPASGVVSRVSMAIGQVVDARDLLLQVSDPSRLMVEALAYDASIASSIGSASAQAPDGSEVKLQFVGATGELRQQALPLVFRVTNGVPLAAGQALRVRVETRARFDGHVLPATALARAASGERVVWVKSGAERFEPRRVESRALSADRVLVTGTLADGERVVVTGASLLSQVR